jgi:hypothetical protein
MKPVIDQLKEWWAAFTKGSGASKRRVLYAERGRDGYVIYKDAQGEISMYFEFGGGDCVAFIQVPTAAAWAKVTKRSVQEREDILRFVAEQAIRDRAPGCDYRLSANYIEFFKR